MRLSLPMPKVRRSGLQNSSLTREPFTTIDDCIELAQELAVRLHQLGDQKYPLGVRKGASFRRKRKEVESMIDSDDSKVVKAGSKTYFFDVKQTKEGKPYLVITESRFQGEGKDRERVSIVVFPEYAQAFLETTQEILRKLG